MKKKKGGEGGGVDEVRGGGWVGVVSLISHAHANLFQNIHAHFRFKVVITTMVT